MAVYDGVPSIRLEGDEERALALVPEAKALLYKVQTFKQRAGVGTFSMSQNIGEDGVIYVLSSEDQNIIHISVAPEVPALLNPPEGETSRSVLTPDFYSGVVFSGYYEERVRENPDGSETEYKVCVSFAPTPTCVQTHDELETGGRQEVERLAVKPWIAFDELNFDNPPPFATQYAKLKPSMYSGTMKKVVQLVMGLGRLGAAKLRSLTSPDTKYMKDVEASGVQVRFDWRYIRTHGISIGTDGTLWLIEISSNRGVLARPLPIFANSNTPEFLDRAIRGGDSAMQRALEDLGCLPTGEAFPGDSVTLNAMIESGDVLRLLPSSELSGFYRCSAYSSAMGWAFNERGNEAHNTAYYFDDDGFQRGVWWAVYLNIGALTPNRRPGEPIGTASATAKLMREGYIYCFPAPEGSPARYVPIKFYNPDLDILQSHEGTPARSAALLPQPHTDTVMFVCFIDNEIHTVKYYYGTGTDPVEVIDTRPDDGCLFAGAWELRLRSEGGQIQRGMYSNVEDNREVSVPSENITEWTSVDLGWLPPSSAFPDRVHSTLSRERRFRATSKSYSLDHALSFTVVAVPKYSREAYYSAFGKRISTSVVLNQLYYQRLTDVNKYLGTNNGTLGVYGASMPNPTYAEVRPIPGAPIDNDQTLMDFAVIHQREETPCGVQYADDGGWFELGNMYQVDLPVTPMPGSYSWVEPPTHQDFSRLKLFTPGFHGGKSLPLSYSDFEKWALPSPDPQTGIAQHIVAMHSALGEETVVYEDNLIGYGTKRVSGYTPDTIHYSDGYPTFIGVNAP